jgi:hypothetical protein
VETKAQADAKAEPKDARDKAKPGRRGAVRPPTSSNPTPRMALPIPKVKTVTKLAPGMAQPKPEDKGAKTGPKKRENKRKKTSLKSDDSQKTSDSESDEDSDVEKKENASLTQKNKVGNQKTQKNRKPRPKERGKVP